MRKLDLNFDLIDSDGGPIRMIPGGPPQTAGQVLGRSLGNAASKGPESIKFWGWALILGSKKPLELDDADLSVLKGWVENHEQMANLVKAPVITAIKKVENEEPAAKV